MTWEEHAYWIAGCLLTVLIPLVLLASVVFGGLYRDHEERNRK